MVMEDDSPWRPIWILGGKKEHLTWIGKDILAWSFGMHIVFYDVPQKRQNLWWCSKVENDDGIACLSGHPVVHVLAFSNKGFSNPKIFVVSYPSMKTISECVRGNTDEYLATAFTSGEHLISLSSDTSYNLTVWSWRNGDKLISVVTPIDDPKDQIIRVSCTKPSMIAQLSLRSGKMLVWEISQAGKILLLTNHEVSLPGAMMPCNMDWSFESHEPRLAIVDSIGNVYISNCDGSEIVPTVSVQRMDISSENAVPSVRWFSDGIVVLTTYRQICFYKKDDKNVWRKIWYVKSIPKPSILAVHRSINDRLFYHTYEGFLMEIAVTENEKNPIVEKRLHCGGSYNFFELVQPWGHHLSAIDNTGELSIVDCYDGREVARLNLELEGKILQLSSHPDYPMAVICSEEGELALVGLRSPESPFLMAKIRLQKERLDLLKFSQCGKYLVVGQRTNGVCYCLTLTRNRPIDVIARLETHCRMTDVLLYDVRGRLKLFVLVVSSKKITVGHHLVLFQVEKDWRTSVEPARYLQLPNAYQFLHYSPEGINFLIGTPYLSRQIHLLEIKDWKEINLVDAVSSEHSVRRVRLSTGSKWITSAAFDGRVTLRNGRNRKLAAILSPHHRGDLGTVKAIGKTSGDLVVSLGHDGSLVGTRSFLMEDATSLNETSGNNQIDFSEYENKRPEVLADYSSLDSGISEILSKRIEIFPAVENGLKKTWVEWIQGKRTLEEEKECFQLKSTLLADFKKLQDKVVELMKNNEACIEIERLPISVFDLDKSTRDSRLKAGKDERENARLELEASCVSMDRVAGWIKSNFWEPQNIIGRSIFAIFDNTEVTNYPTKNDDPTANDFLHLARFFKDSIRTVMDADTFYPWKSYTDSQLDLALQPKSKFDLLNERQRMGVFLSVEDDEDRDTNTDEIEDRLANEGTTTHRFIEKSQYYYSQFESYSFSQILINNRSIVNDCKLLREFFNKQFDDVFSSKEREVNVILEKHERIRHIDLELRRMFDQLISNLPIDPQWKLKENPNDIVKVLDSEIKTKPYVTQSRQELLDKRAVEAERLRQILLADDFREKALMKMMDGVLEVRWEDIIKRDIKKPQCMLTKEPDMYNTEDLSAIRQYEKDVEFLKHERLRYHRILETDLTKIGSSLRESIEKFNTKIHDLYSLKMRVEAAIQQLNLRNIRDFRRYLCRMKKIVVEDETRKSIATKMKNLQYLIDQLRTLQSLKQEYKNHYEISQTKERTVEKKFRSEFPSLGKTSTDFLLKEYKRRPRISLKNISASELIDLGKSAVSRVKVTYLSNDSIEYLKHLDNMDVKPIGLPEAIEDQHWDHLIRMRRHRIEIETRSKSQMAEIRETEKAIAECEKKIDKTKADTDSLKEKITEMRQDRFDYDLDMEIQLVLKMGQIEIKPIGKLDDAKFDLLIPRREIENVNQTIVDTGRNKIKTMNHVINFHRGIILKEWEHRCMRMKIDDLKEELFTLENVLVTRDIREFLKKQSEGSVDDKTPQQLEKELEAVKNNCQKNLQDWIDRLKDVEAKIESVNRKNKSADRKIEVMNVNRWDLEWQRDIEGETREKGYSDRIMSVVRKRAMIVRKLQKEYTDVLALQTEHELLRLRKYPVLNSFKTINDDSGGC